MVMLNQRQLNELHDILRDNYDEKLSRKEVFEVGTTLVTYFELLARIHYREKPKEEHKPKVDSSTKPL